MKPENPAGVLGTRVPPPLPATDKRLTFRLEPANGAVVLHCRGRIIFGPEARALTELVADVLPAVRRMVVDLDGIEIVDSAGLGELVLLHMWAEAAGYSLKFASPREPVRRLLELTNLIAVFDAYDSVADAVSAMRNEMVFSA